jgi:hypothetical protein
MSKIIAAKVKWANSSMAKTKYFLNCTSLFDSIKLMDQQLVGITTKPSSTQ